MLECPRCKSNAVTSINGNLLCLHCGNSEALEDYPIAAPHYEPVKDPQDERIPEAITPSQNRMWDTIQQSRGQVMHLQTKLNEHLDKTKKGKGDYV